MVDQQDEPQGETPETGEQAPVRRRGRRAASRPSGPPAHAPDPAPLQPAAPTAGAFQAGDSEAGEPEAGEPEAGEPLAEEALAEEARGHATDLEQPDLWGGVTSPSADEVETAADEQLEAEEPDEADHAVASSDPDARPVLDAPPARRSRRATRGVTTVAFSSEPVAEAPVLATPPAEVPAVAVFQPPDESRATRSRNRRRAQGGGQAAARAGSEAAARNEMAQDEMGQDEMAQDEVRQDQGAEPALPGGEELLPATEPTMVDTDESGAPIDDDADDDERGPRRRRRRGGRRRRRGQGEAGAEVEGETGEDGGEPGEGDRTDVDADASSQEAADAGEQGESGDQAESADDGSGEGGSGGSRRRRRRRRRAGVAEEMEDLSTDDVTTVVKIREGRRQATDEITSVRGSTRIEAKRQRRRDGREAGRRRAPILTEAEFLARREAVNRVMCVREHGDRTQIAVLEDGVLVEHYVNRAESSSMVGNVYLGKVQNVLPSMEAAFVDIGRGRNAVLYAGEVNWDAAGLEGQPKRIELALKSGDPVLVQVTKDPIGHKGARLTSQISLPGRFLVYVPEGSMTGISRKLPDTERARLKGILKDVVPDGAGVIVRTAAEGATEEQLTSDVQRLTAQWADIQKKAKSGSAPVLLYGEPDLAIKVVRDIFNEDFTTLLVEGAQTWQTLHEYIGWVAPDLLPKLQQWTEPGDLYAAHRIDEQLAKALDRKVWLPSGGSLVIDRTEAMTVVDVNTGKFTGQGGNLEETVTRNNLEAAEEIVRQLRLRDIGGIIVVDFIDMVLESNRDLVLRRLVECLGRDRTKHQVAEVTSLGLVQMTRKRIGQGLLEVFSTPCEACGGRGHVVHAEPVGGDADEGGGRRDRGDRGDRERGGRRGRQAPVLPANLGGKQTGKLPPPPRFDEHGHIEHEHLGHDEAAHGEEPDVPTELVAVAAAPELGEQVEAAEQVNGPEQVDGAEQAEPVAIAVEEGIVADTSIEPAPDATHEPTHEPTYELTDQPAGEPFGGADARPTDQPVEEFGSEASEEPAGAAEADQAV